MEPGSIDKISLTLQGLEGIQFETNQDNFFTYIKIESEDILPVMQALRNNMGMNYLANLTAVDLNEEFEIIYHLYAIPDNKQKIVIKTRVPRNHAEVTSVFSLYPTADWQEREVYDLLGIRFTRHPNLIRILLPDDFTGHPLRKDFKKEV